MTKKLKSFKLAICTLLLALTISCPAWSAPQCAALFSPRSLHPLITRMDQLGIRLELHRERDDEEGIRYYEIRAFQNGIEVGTITMTPLSVNSIEGTARLLFDSHIDVSYGEVSLKGQGLGSYLYAAGATFIHSQRAVLFSSQKPSTEAQNTWQRMIEGGWALKSNERDRSFLVNGQVSPDYVAYRFNQDLLNAGFFKTLLSRLNSVEGQ